jgi:hypothetical protein
LLLQWAKFKASGSFDDLQTCMLGRPESAP